MGGFRSGEKEVSKTFALIITIGLYVNISFALFALIRGHHFVPIPAWLGWWVNMGAVVGLIVVCVDIISLAIDRRDNSQIKALVAASLFSPLTWVLLVLVYLPLITLGIEGKANG